MGRHSKATITRVNNLRQAQTILRTHVDDISSCQDPYFDGNQLPNHQTDLPEEGFFILDENLGPESEDEECEDEFTDKNVTDADITAFTQLLAEAQLAAVKAERAEKSEKPNRKRHYTGNSKRTKQYHAQKRRKLDETGQQFIQIFFKKKTDTDSTPKAANLDSESENESEDEEAAAEIVADLDSGVEHLHRLFPEDNSNIQVSC
jgi:hypothetical protein